MVLLSSYHLCSGQNPAIDSLKLVLANAREDTSKVNILIAICQNEYRSSPKNAIIYGNEARILSEKLDYQLGLANSCKYIGMGYYFLGNYGEAVNFWQQSLSSFEEINDKVGIANILNNIGAVYANVGDDTKALEYHLRSLKASEEVKDTLRIVTSMINIGVIYLNKPATHDKAFEYYLAALPLCEQIGNNDALGTASVNLGEIYYQREDYDTALFYFEKSLDAFRKSNSGNVPYTLTNIGKVYMKRGDFKRAIEFQQDAYEIAKQSDAKLEMTASLLGLAGTYFEQGNLKSSITTYHNARQIAEEIGAKNELKETYNGLSTSYAKMLDFSNAYKYQTLLTAINDTLYITANDKKIQSLQFNYELEKKESQIDLLTKDKALQEAIIQKQKFARNTFIIGFIAAILVAFETYRNYLRKVRTNIELENKDKIKNEYVLRVTHDIKGHLAAIQSCTGVIRSKTIGPLNEAQEKFANRTFERTELLLNFVRNLLNLTKERLKRTGKNEFEEFLFKDLINKIVSPIQILASDRSLDFNLYVDNSIEMITGNPFTIEELYSNLLENAVKYTPPNGQITLTVKNQNNHFLTEISDSGIGIPKEELSNVFEEFYRATNVSKDIKTGSGLGLSIVKQIVENHNGRIWVNSELGIGTKFIFILPKNPAIGNLQKKLGKMRFKNRV